MSAVFSLMHLSDPHFHSLPRHPLQWLSKRGLGAANLALNRARLYPLQRAKRLVALVDGMDWQHLLITGDLTQLSLEREFDLARRTLAPLLERGPGRVTVLPGNHDRYVPPRRGEQGFEAYFGEFFGSGEVGTHLLTDGWALAAWDSAIPAPWFSAAGRVKPSTLAATEKWMAGLGAGTRVIVANHYPLFFQPPYHFRPGHELLELDSVREWVAQQKIALYLHGHLHRNWVLRTDHGSHFCTHVNSASSTRVQPAGHSAFHRIELEGGDYRVLPFFLA